MNWASIKRTLIHTGDKVKAHSPEILTGLGIGGMVVSTVLAVRVTPKAIDILDSAKQEKGDELTNKELLTHTWKLYLPSAALTLASGAALIFSNRISNKRVMSLTAAYDVSRRLLTSHKEATLEEVGEETALKIRDKANLKEAGKVPYNEDDIITVGTSTGTILCFEPLTGRYFWSDQESIRARVNDFNSFLIGNDYASLNEFFYKLGIPDVKMGHDLGWSVRSGSGGNGKGLAEIDFTSGILDNGTPYLIMDYYNPPQYGYVMY